MRRRRRGNLDPAVEAPRVAAAVAIVGEASAVALPMDRRCVSRHRGTLTKLRGDASPFGTPRPLQHEMPVKETVCMIRAGRSRTREFLFRCRATGVLSAQAP